MHQSGRQMFTYWQLLHTSLLLNHLARFENIHGEEMSSKFIKKVMTQYVQVMLNL